jgi:hypothetical protein
MCEPVLVIHVCARHEPCARVCELAGQQGGDRPVSPPGIDEKRLPITGIQVILDNSLIAWLRNLKATAETER